MKHDRHQPKFHQFEDAAAQVLTATFRVQLTGALHTWEIVQYTDAAQWKARNATTRLHHITSGNQTEYPTAKWAMTDHERLLMRAGVERLTPWAPADQEQAA